MLKLLLKEMKLDVLWVVYLFPLLGVMTLLPNYPLIVGMGYSVLAVFIYFQSKRENLSQEFCATLPVKRSHIVWATALFVMIIQGMFLLTATIGAVVARFVNTDGNLVGLDPNLTFFGVALACYGVFNAIFFPMYYKTGYKHGVPVLLGLVGFMLVYGIAEALVQAVPQLTAMLDGYEPQYLPIRAIVLVVGIAIYVVCTIVFVNVSVKKFEKVNL